jgi:hypothetical protein
MRFVALGLGPLALLMIAQPALARQASGPVTRTDRYGNARPVYSNRRPQGLYQSATQRRALRGYQSIGRRSNSRGGLVAFSLQTDRSFSARARQLRMRSAMPGFEKTMLQPSLMARTGATTPQMARAFQRYGGFDERRGSQAPADIAGLLSRKTDLTNANASNAPIDRAMWRRGTAGGLASYSKDRPFEVSELPLIPDGAPSMGDHVRRRVIDNAAVSRDTGWERFKDGEFRGAMRAFQAAYTLDPQDVESQIAASLCYLFSGSTRAAAVAVRKIARSVENPFMYDLDLAQRLENPGVVLNAKINTQRFVEAAPDIVEAAALQVFLLWHIGERDEAQRLSQALPAISPGSAFANWPAKLSEALTSYGITGG